MEFNQLSSFLEVVEEGSVSRAAKRLHLTQPAVTKQIQALERELKTVLLDRTGQGVQLTATGAILHDYAKRVHVLLTECQNLITDQEVGTTGQIVLGAGTTTCIFELPRWLQLLHGQLPGVDVVVRTGDSHEVVNLTLDREIDLGLVTTTIEHPNLIVTPLFEEEIILVVAKEPLLTLGQNHQAERALSDYPLILFPRHSGFREYLDQAIENAGLTMHIKMETDSVEVIKSFVSGGLGASFLPKRAVEAELAAGSLHQVHLPYLPTLKRQTCVIRRTDRHLRSSAKALLKILQDS